MAGPLARSRRAARPVQARARVACERAQAGAATAPPSPTCRLTGATPIASKAPAALRGRAPRALATSCRCRRAFSGRRRRRMRMKPPWERPPHHQISGHARAPLAVRQQQRRQPRPVPAAAQEGAARRGDGGCVAVRAAGTRQPVLPLNVLVSLSKADANCARSRVARSTARCLRACAFAVCCTCTRCTRAEGGASSGDGRVGEAWAMPRQPTGDAWAREVWPRLGSP